MRKFWGFVAAIIMVTVAFPAPAQATMTKRSVGSHSIPNVWLGDTEIPQAIQWPVEVDQEALQRALENEALNAVVEAATNNTATAQTAEVKKFVPWAERPVVYWRETGLCLNSYVGQFRIPRLGVDQQVYWDFNQSTTDHPSKMNIWGYSGLPGEPGLAVDLYDHNYQTGRIVAQCLVGECVYLDSTWGSYTYRFTGSEIAQNDPSTLYHTGSPWVSSRVGEDPRAGYIGDFCSSRFPQGHVASTTLDGANNGELYFITCYPLNQKVTTQRLVMRFDCVDGPVLVY